MRTIQKFGFMCDVGGKGKGNQDSAFYNEFILLNAPGSPEYRHFSHQGILAMVCDGVSASNHGEKGSSFSIQDLGARIMTYLMSGSFKIEEIGDKLSKFIVETNDALLNKYNDLIEKGKVPKTTLVGILVIGQYLWVFNLGDSRAFLIKDEIIGQISTDHIGSGAMHEITQALGQEKITPAVKFYNWAYEQDYSAKNKVFNSNYYFIICSDGLTDVVTQEEIKSTILSEKNKSMQEIVQILYDLTIERNIDDNVSIVLCDLAKYFEEISPISILKLSYPENEI